MAARIELPPGVTVARCFQRYDSDTRATHASSHRLGYRQRYATGEYFYVASNIPDRAFSARWQAARAAIAAGPSEAA